MHRPNTNEDKESCHLSLGLAMPMRDNEQVFTAVEAFVAGLNRPYGVAAGN
jgi:hypothetical protein